VKTYTIVPTIVPDFLSRTTLIHIILVSESAFLVFIDTTLVLLLGFILTVSGYLSTPIQNFVDPLELLFCYKMGIIRIGWWTICRSRTPYSWFGRQCLCFR